jgi:hypothetical protein
VTPTGVGYLENVTVVVGNQPSNTPPSEKNTFSYYPAILDSIKPNIRS